MYRRFLNNNDYISIVTEEALYQLIRGNEERLAQAEEAAEASIIEYLTDNYEIEKCLAVGHNLREYNLQITYPAGVHFYHDGKIYVTMRPLNGCHAPAVNPYWRLIEDEVDFDAIEPYSQLKDYAPSAMVKFNSNVYVCLDYNGYNFNNIRIPGITGWEEVAITQWQANIEYELWAPVEYGGEFYALISLENIDLTVNPLESDNWGKIGEYTADYEYKNDGHDYVVYERKVFIPVMNVNADKPVVGFNITQDDPRNSNIKKHMLRLAVYELHKLISPNNISSARITDYETSIMWLRDASRLKINPHIPRKVDEENKAVTEYAIATFARDYDPNKNPWQI